MKGKVDSKVWDGINVGYETVGVYRIFVPELDRVITSRDVVFMEKLTNRADETTVGTTVQSGGNIDESTNDLEIDSETDGSANVIPTTAEDEAQNGAINDDEETTHLEENENDGEALAVRRGRRKPQMPKRYRPEDNLLAFLTAQKLNNHVDNPVPQTLNEAMKN